MKKKQAERLVLKAAGEKGVKFPTTEELDRQAMVKIGQAVREVFDAFRNLENACRKVNDRDYRGEALSRIRLMGKTLHELDMLEPR